MTRQRQFTAKPIHDGKAVNSRAKRNSFVNGVIMKKIICILLLLSIFTTALISCKGVTVIEDESETEAVTKETTDTETADTNVETEPVDDGIDHSFDWQYDYDFDYDSGSVEADSYNRYFGFHRLDERMD